MTCSKRYADRYAALFAEMRLDMESLARDGSIGRARELSAATGQWFNATVPPGYFGGDLDSETVLVHLNPKQTDERVAVPDLGARLASFDDLVERAIHFGDQVYGPSSSRTHQSQFDRRQLAFLKALGALPFVEERSEEDRYANLAMSIDAKLQMELVPYGSPDFATAAFTAAIVRPHLDRLMTVIAARPRRYVLFCGAVFQSVLRPFVVEEHVFRMTKLDGTPEKSRCRFASLEIPFNGEKVRAGLATSYARQGMNMRAYGEFVRQLYPA